MGGRRYYVGVDVGTYSVRAALVSANGRLEATSAKAISVWEPSVDVYEQSSDEIWSAVCKVVKDVTQDISPSEVRGLGFDATCSMVVLDKNFKPAAANDGEISDHNVILWMDHRALDQAKKINETNHRVLRNVGGIISPEMQLPKLLWLKQNLPNHWKNYGHFFDLPDFLTWKATGSLSRSLCSLVCKWTYQTDGEAAAWDPTIFTQLGLDDLVDEDFFKIGQKVMAPGCACGEGLTTEAAELMGLEAGTPVASSIIDAHAGGIGTLGCRPKVTETTLEALPLASVSITSKLALICGTSTCHLIVSEKPIFVKGVWGPYFSAMMPRLWLNEGGQSATGKLLDHIIDCHPAKGWVTSEAESREIHVYSLLNEVLEFMAKRENLRSVSLLSSAYHVWPDYHGNRSPLANPLLRGMISGLSLSSDTDDLAIKYLATMQALIYGTRHIIETMKTAGHSIDVVYICGGLVKNELFVQLNADILGLPVVIPDTRDCVLLGSAILAATASDDFADIKEAMTAMSGCGKVLFPKVEDKEYHQRKYKVFLNMMSHQQLYGDIMSGKTEGVEKL